MISGYVRTAGIDSGGDAAHERDLAQLRRQAASVEGEFLLDARRGVERLIEELAQTHCGPSTRWCYEAAFLTYPIFLLSRIGYNFFWSSFLAPALRSGVEAEPLLTIDFYVPATIFLLIWSSMLVLLFTWRLRSGLTARIHELAQRMAESRLLHGLFPSLEETCLNISKIAEPFRTCRIGHIDFRSNWRHPPDFLVVGRGFRSPDQGEYPRLQVQSPSRYSAHPR